MFKAIFRWLKAAGYFLTGNVDSATKELNKSPKAIKAKYDSIIKDKISRIQDYKEALSGLIAQKDIKANRVKKLIEECENLERLKLGSLAKAKKIAKKYKDRPDEAKSDIGYKECYSAFKDFSSTLEEKERRVDELENSIEEYESNISYKKIELKGLIREIESLRAEKHDVVADIISAQQEKEIADSISNISEDKTHDQLKELRELRQEMKANAKVSKEMSEATSGVEEDYLSYANEDKFINEFDQLLNIADNIEGDVDKVKPVKVKKNRSKVKNKSLPE